MKKTPQEVYELLIDDESILSLEGQIKYEMGGIDIIVKQRDVVGNILQEWLQGWLNNKGIEYALNSNTQMPPDFFLDPDNLQCNLLEVKAFNRISSPGFDIADFRMYQEEIIQKPYMLDVDYLIFGYVMDEKTGKVLIKDLWLKKVWEITRKMAGWPLNLQVKNNVVHKIRPAAFYSDNSRYPIFRSKEDFLSAIEETVYQNPKTHNESGSWKAKFIQSYEEYYNCTIDIPRWSEISDKYER